MISHVAPEGRTTALYYPYSRALAPETLKRAVLLFDEVAFVDSQPWFMRKELLRDERAPQAAAVERDYDYLRDEGVVKILEPSKAIQDYDVFLTANVRHDIGDDAFLDEAVSASAETWRVLTERLPPSFTTAFYAGAGTFWEAVSLQRIIAAASGTAGPPDDGLAPGTSNLSVEEALERLRRRYRFVIGGNPHVRLEAYELPFAHASSLRISEILLLSAMNGGVPFTDSRLHDRLLRLKIAGTVAQIRSHPHIRDALEIDVPALIPAEALTMRVLDRLVPSEALVNRTVEELLEYRRANEDGLRRLHGRLAALSTAIESVESGVDFELRIRRIIDGTVMPEIQAAADGMARSYEEAFGKFAAAAAGASVGAGTGLAVSLLGGLGSWEALAAGAFAVVGAGGAAATGALPDAIATVWNAKRRAARSNAFAYLTNIGGEGLSF
jgi:hypothetical protein